MHKKTIILSDSAERLSLAFCLLGQSRLLVAKGLSGITQYIQLPFEIKIQKKGQALILTCDSSFLKELLLTYNKISFFLKNLGRFYYKKLVLKGLGFRMNLLEADGKMLLNLKVGYSHIISVNIIKKKMEVFLKKNSVILKSANLAFLGNFSQKIKSLKRPNVYSGKGFWYKNEKITYKHFKKK